MTVKLKRKRAMLLAIEKNRDDAGGYRLNHSERAEKAANPLLEALNSG